MIKNVMVTENKEVKLDELFREAWNGNIMLNDYNWTIFVSNLGNKVKLQKGGLLGSSKITHDDRFEIEVKPKVIKHPYRGENKAYVDYLLESTFKGWRA